MVSATSSNVTVIDVVYGTTIPVGEDTYLTVHVGIPESSSSISSGGIARSYLDSSQTVYEINEINTIVYSDGIYETSCEVTAGIMDANGIGPRASQDKGKTESAIKGTLTLTYSLRNNNEDIRITKVSGSWSQAYSNTGIDTQNHQVQVIDGVPGGEQAYYYPSGRTYSYNTGWDYVPLYPTLLDAGSGPRAFSDCEWRITGMGTTWRTFTIPMFLDFSDYL